MDPTQDRPSDAPPKIHSPKIHPPDEAFIDRAAGDLLRGELIGLPTETVYGLATRGDDATAVAKIFAAKNRPATNPLILHVGGPNDALLWLAPDLEPVTLDRFRRLSSFWPGPLTLIGPKSPRVPDIVTAGGDSVAIRVPNHPVALAVIRRCKTIAGRSVPIAAPSANVSNYVSPTTAAHVADGLADRVSMILDGGPCGIGLESTIVDLGHDSAPATILRSGGITGTQIEAILGEPVRTNRVVSAGEEPVTAPGQFAKHYSPRTPLTLLRADASPPPPGPRVLRISFDRIDPNWPKNVWTFTPTGDLAQAAMNLYATLRAADAAEFDRIEIRPCRADGIGEAILDRLGRAAAGEQRRSVV